jgi:hypothetical protein
MPLRPENFRHLPGDDFRRQRAYLADEVFAIPREGDHRPTELVDEETWDGMIDLPTDVLLMTSDHMGGMLADAHDQCRRWIEAMPYEAEKPDGFMFDAALDAADEFHAAPFIAAHGYYRQATAGLRTTLEGMTTAAAFAVSQDTGELRRWRAGEIAPSFKSMVKRLGGDPGLATFDRQLGGSGVFGLKPNGILLDVYANLCRYSHGQPGHTNGDIWQSNGPVFVRPAFTQFWIDFGDALVLCYTLYKIGWADLELPDAARSLFGFADERWDGRGSQLLGEFFAEP